MVVMELIVACGVCGMDPGTDSLVLHSLVAAGIGTPWYFRTQVLGAVVAIRRRLRGEPDPVETCPLPNGDSGTGDYS
jgi:hypothetical protein